MAQGHPGRLTAEYYASHGIEHSGQRYFADPPSPVEHAVRRDPENLEKETLGQMKTALVACAAGAAAFVALLACIAAKRR